MKDKDTAPHTRTSWKNLQLLVKSVRSQRYLLGLVVLCTGLGVVGNLGIAYFMRYSVDAVFAGEAQQFLHMSLLFVAMVLGIAGTTFGERYFAGRFAETAVGALREKLVRKINKLPVSQLDQQDSGDMISRLTNDINLVHEFLFHRLVPLVFLPVMGVAALLYLVLISWQLTLAVMLLTPLLGMSVSLVAKPMGRTSQRLQETLGEVNALVRDSAAGHQEIKAFNLQTPLAARFARKVNQAVGHALSLAKQRSLMHGVSNLAGLTPFLISFGYGGYLAIEGVITLGAFVAFINLLNHLSHPLNALPHLIGQYHTAMAGFERIHAVLDAEEEPQGGEAFSRETDSVLAFEGVRFGYGDTPVLDGLSLEIRRGETIALVGSSGSGKSTILKLITNFYTPQSGTIKAFGQPLSCWNRAKLRESMALVTQDTYLYPTTIEENIGFGRPDATREQVVAAAKLANAHAFILNQPNGYGTIVGERGSRLSGGQKQRLAIARAMLKDAEILLLDEPTSALDTESEHLVQQALDSLMQEKTTIVAAHRLSTIKQADRILVLDSGRVAESGTHTQLIERRGLYYQLYHTQFADEGSLESQAV